MQSFTVALRWIALAVAALLVLPATIASAASNGMHPPPAIGVEAGAGQVRITWAGSDYTPANYSRVQVDAQPGPGSCVGSIGAGECTITGLENGKAYTFAVYAVGTNGWTTDVAIVGPVWPCCGAPAAPASVAAVAEQGAAVVSWEPPMNAQAAGNSFSYAVTSTPSGGTCSTTERSCRISGLEDGTGYSFSVVAINGRGEGPAATSPQVTPIGPPGAPTGVQVFLGAKGRGTVSWVSPTKTGGAVVDRYVAVAEPGGASCETTGALSCSVAGLTNGTRYRFTVTAYNSVAAGPQSAASAVARPLAGPGQARAVKARLTGNRAVVSWTAPRSTGGLAIRDYVVRSSPAGASCRTRGTTCSVGGLRPGTRYVFTVQARNAKGLGLVAESPAVTTPTPRPPAPADPVKPEQTLS